MSKQDLRRIAQASGAQVLISFADENGEETIDPACLGEAEEVCEERVGDNDFIFFKRKILIYNYIIVQRSMSLRCVMLTDSE